MYRKMIIEFTGCSEKDAKITEEWMRDQSPTLDHLSRPQFLKLARDAYKALLWSRTPEGIEYVKQLEKEFYG